MQFSSPTPGVVKLNMLTTPAYLLATRCTQSQATSGMNASLRCCCPGWPARLGTIHGAGLTSARRKPSCGEGWIE